MPSAPLVLSPRFRRHTETVQVQYFIGAVAAIAAGDVIGGHGARSDAQRSKGEVDGNHHECHVTTRIGLGTGILERALVGLVDEHLLHTSALFRKGPIRQAHTDSNLIVLWQSVGLGQKAVCGSQHRVITDHYAGLIICELDIHIVIHHHDIAIQFGPERCHRIRVARVGNRFVCAGDRV